jgi:membrane protein insertase Oxa1/YidC/SpoIIIJ
MEIVILIFTLLNVSFSIASKWFSAKRVMKPFYILDAIAGVLMIVTNTFAYIKDSSNYGLLAYYILGVWQISMGAYGLYTNRRNT